MDWKERFNKEFDKEYPSVRSYTAGHLQEWVINFIEQLISERDKEWQKEKSELEYKLYMKTDKMYQILTQLENCLHILGKIESQKEHHPTVQDYLDGDESLQAMWRSYRD